MAKAKEEKKKKAGSGDYGADNITILEGLEAVRRRPAMYIGGTSIDGLHHLVYEVVDNSIDEALGGHCKNISVVIHKDNSVTVIDDGRGIPVELHKERKKSALEVVMTVLHAGGKFDKDSYKVSGGLHGVGVSVVNALSEWLEVEVYRNGEAFKQEYKRGKPVKDVAKIGKTGKRGTKITFMADDKIFETLVYSYDTLSNRLRELAFLNRGINIQIKDERNGKDHEFEYCHHHGLSDIFWQRLCVDEGFYGFHGKTMGRREPRRQEIRGIHLRGKSARRRRSLPASPAYLRKIYGHAVCPPASHGPAGREH